MKKLVNAVSSVLLAVLMVFLNLSPVSAAGEDFDTFLENKWKEMMQKDYVALHFSVKDYEKMGLTKPEVTFGRVGYDVYAEELQKAQAFLDELHTYDYNSLNDTQQHDYLVVEKNLKENIDLYQYPQFDEMFNPYNGQLSDLVPTLTEFVFYRAEDIDDYLTLAGDFSRYMDEMMEFTRQQASQGYFMRDAALDEQLKEMDEFVAKGEENPLIIIFEKNVDAFEGLTDQQRADYKARNKDIVLNQIIPSYQKIRGELEQLRGSRSVTGSVYEYEGGKEYYAALLRKKTSTDLTVEEVSAYLTKSIKESYLFMMDVMLSDLPGSNPSLPEGNQITTLQTPQEILDYLQAHLEGFPKGPEVTFTPSYLDPSVANPSVMAYYMQTPIDDVKDNVIRINGQAAKPEDINTLYYTLSHEGFPGHLYQFTWYYSQNPNPIRHDISMIGYSEGWAQYVERIMLKRAPLDEYSQEVTAANVFIGYVMQAAADVLVNGLGYDEAQLGAWLKNEVEVSESLAKDFYGAVVDMPGSIIPYGFGMAKFWEFREKVQSALGEEFNLEDYHLQLLTNGMRPFEVVEADLTKYVESKGKTMPADFEFFRMERGDKITGSSKIVDFLMKYGVFILIGVVLIIGLILFLIIRGLIRLFRKKKANP